VATLAGEGNQIFVTAVVTADTGKAVVQAAAIEVAEDSLPYFRPQIPETGLVPLFMYPLKFLKTILDTAVIVG